MDQEATVRFQATIRGLYKTVLGGMDLEVENKLKISLSRVVLRTTMFLCFFLRTVQVPEELREQMSFGKAATSYLPF